MPGCVDWRCAGPRGAVLERVRTALKYIEPKTSLARARLRLDDDQPQPRRRESKITRRCCARDSLELSEHSSRNVSRDAKNPEKKAAKSRQRARSAERWTLFPLCAPTTPSLQRSIDKGCAVLADREEWEGMTEWRCQKCGCD
jgi:hypothetical protein